MSFRASFLAIIPFAVAAFPGGCHNQAEPEQSPNIIFVFTDDHASHGISAYGSEINETPNIGVRTDRYKLIYYYEIDEWELFDLDADPEELDSRHNDPTYAPVRKELIEELERLRTQYQVPAEDTV